MTILQLSEHCQAGYSKKLLMLERNTPFIDHSWLPMTSGLPTWKCTLKGWRFEGIKCLDKNASALLNVIPNGEYHKCLCQFQHDYAKGEYSEDGDLVTPLMKLYV
jgi:hypothetical protein